MHIFNLRYQKAVMIAITRLGCIVLATMLPWFTSVSPLYAYSSTRYHYVTLRTDLSAVSTARDYISSVDTIHQPSQSAGTNQIASHLSIAVPGSFNSMSLEVNMLEPDDCGFMSKCVGWRLQVYGFSVQCLYGLTMPDGSCVSTRNDPLVGLGNWHQLEFVTYNEGFWIARIRNLTTGWVQDIAKIFDTHLTITNIRVGTAYYDDNPPYVAGTMYHWHPSYMVWGTGFQLWPASSGGNNNKLIGSSLSAQECPLVHKAGPNLSGDPRYWSLGYIDFPGAICSANPFF